MQMHRVLCFLALAPLPATLAQNTQTTAPGVPPPVVSVTAPDAQAAETSAGQTPNNAHFLITRTGNTNVAVTVTWSLSGTASGNADVQPIPSGVTLQPGQTRAEIPVRPVDDTVAEPEETLVLRLLPSPCAQVVPLPPDCPVLGTAVEAVVRIADNDAAPPVVSPVITLQTVSAAATEAGAGVATNRLSFLLRRLLNTEGSLTVGLQWGGTAARGADFTAPEAAVFAPGQAELLVHAPPLQDALVEGDETVTVSLRPCASNSTTVCHTVGSPSSGGGVIRDDDTPPPPLPVVTLAVADGQAGETRENQAPNPGVIVLNRTGNTNTAVTVYLSIQGTATGNLDFQPIPTSIPLAAGQTRAEIVVRPVDDNEVEPVETVILRLLAPTVAQNSSAAATGGYQTGTPAEALVSIADNDEPAPPAVLPVITVQTVTGTTAEGAAGNTAGTSGPGLLTFALRRLENTSGQTTVLLQWTGTATRGLDFQGAPEQVVFAAGQSLVTLAVAPVQDTLVEGEESVVVSIVPVNCGGSVTASTACYAVGASSTAAGVILDDDAPAENRPPVVAWLAPAAGTTFLTPADLRLAASAADADGTVRRLTFLANGAPLGTVSNATPALANFAGTSATALYEWLWLQPAPGEYRLQAEAADDQGAVTRTPAVTVLIRAEPNLPQTVVSVTATDREAAEPGSAGTASNRGQFRFRREGDLTTALEALYRVEGTASNGVDFVALGGVARFAAGQAAVEVPVVALGDNLTEGPETVRVVLVEPDCAHVVPAPAGCHRVGLPAADQVVIVDAQPAANLPPVAQVVNPWQGQVFRSPADIRLAAEAWDADGTVARVEFFAGDRSLGVAAPADGFTNNVASAEGVVAPRPSQPRFELLWTEAPAGRHVIRAVATDNRGARGVSRPVEIQVVEITAPVTVTLTVSDSTASETSGVDGGPDTAEFVVHRTGPTNQPLRVFLQLGGRALPGLDYLKPEFAGVVIPAGADAASFPIVPEDDDQPEGPESVEVAVVPPRWLATGDGGSLLPIQYVVGEPARAAALLLDNDVPATNLFPRVRLVRPEPRAVFTAPARVGLAAEAFDLDGSVTLLEFFANDERIGSLPGVTNGTSSATHNLLWDNVPAGEYSLRAEATDDRGALSRSDPVRVRVEPAAVPPVVEVFAVDPRASEQPEPGANGPDTALFRFRRSGPTNDALTVAYAVSGTAGNGVDCAFLPGAVVIPAGKVSEAVEVVALADGIAEPLPETVVLSIATNAVNHVAGPRREAAAYIVDALRDPSTGGLPGGELLVEVATPVEGLVSVQVSTNLVDWTHISTVPAAGGRARFVDPEARGLTRRFYQVLPAPIHLETIDD